MFTVVHGFRKVAIFSLVPYFSEEFYLIIVITLQVIRRPIVEVGMVRDEALK